MKKLYHICLTHLAREYYEKLRFKTKTKIPTLNSYISKARANSESKLKFSESSFSFLQNNIVFCTLYPRGYMAGGSALYNPWCRCQQLAVLKEVMMSESFEFAVFCLFLLEMRRNFWKTAIFHFWIGQKKCFYLIHSAREYFEKVTLKKQQQQQQQL